MSPSLIKAITARAPRLIQGGTQLYNKATSELKDLPNKALNNPQITGAIAGGALGGTAGYFLADLFWDDPSRAQKLITGVTGLLIGGAGGALAMHELHKKAPNTGVRQIQSQRKLPTQKQKQIQAPRNEESSVTTGTDTGTGSTTVDSTATDSLAQQEAQQQAILLSKYENPLYSVYKGIPHDSLSPLARNAAKVIGYIRDASPSLDTKDAVRNVASGGTSLVSLFLTSYLSNRYIMDFFNNIGDKAKIKSILLNAGIKDKDISKIFKPYWTTTRSGLRKLYTSLLNNQALTPQNKAQLITDVGGKHLASKFRIRGKGYRNPLGTLISAIFSIAAASQAGRHVNNALGNNRERQDTIISVNQALGGNEQQKQWQ